MPAAFSEAVTNTWPLMTDLIVLLETTFGVNLDPCTQGRSMYGKYSASYLFIGNHCQSRHGDFLWISEQLNIRSAITLSRTFTRRLYLCALHKGANHQSRQHFILRAPRDVLHGHAANAFDAARKKTYIFNLQQAVAYALTTAITPQQTMFVIIILAQAASLPPRETTWHYTSMPIGGGRSVSSTSLLCNPLHHSGCTFKSTTLVQPQS